MPIISGGGGGGTTLPVAPPVTFAQDADVTFSLDAANGLLFEGDIGPRITVQGDGGAGARLDVVDNNSFREAQLNSGTTAGTGGFFFNDGNFNRVVLNDQLFMLRINAAPADGSLVANQLSLWFDSTNGAAKLMVKAKQADGTVKTASIALA